ncbi:ABC transporter substrate-binding protein [Microbaculum marinisediminis]|uniref:ABC transporter substrate-binding protein n=1 Tax=Microbaculum marinisediminis TaxID=2931392 RepID=A0AAW5R3T2_9HYPH|nr:ABC transporter substrate-binding protein [Microbaculum sp. A6E488]MCT8974583.1 ABC transporter substrate-binding protein [Microbaculum sp. A6E488]
MNAIKTVISALALGAGMLPALAQAEDINLGMVIATTGPFAGGEASLIHGTRMAIEEINAAGGINGDNLVLVIEDTGSEQTGAINAFNRIVSIEPVAIMNTTISGFVMSQMGMIEDEGIPTFTGGASPQLAADAKGTEALFRVRTSDILVAKAAARFATENLGLEKIAVLRLNNEYGNGWIRMIEEQLAEDGKTPVAVESFESVDRDVTAQILRIKNAGTEAIIVAGDPPNHLVIVQQIRQLGFEGAVIVSNSGVLPSTLSAYAPGAAEGIYGTVDSLPVADPAHAEWVERYRSAYDMDPDFAAAEYYDGVKMLAEAIAKVGTDRAALVAELRGIDGHKGVGTTYSYANGGDGGTSVAIVQVENGGLKLVTSVD